MESEGYFEEPTSNLAWHEHIRLRPGMYVGTVNTKGLVDLLKGLANAIITTTSSDRFTIELSENLAVSISFNNYQKASFSNWGYFSTHPYDHFRFEACILNALSKEFRTTYFNSEREIVAEHTFAEGKPVRDDQAKTIDYTGCEITFVLDERVWGEAFAINTNFLTHELREYAYLFKQTRFAVAYREGSDNRRYVYHFQQGLKDRVDIEALKGVRSTMVIEQKLDGLYLDLAFTFHLYPVESLYLKSFVNNTPSLRHGSHLKGLLKGLATGFTQYVERSQLARDFNISENEVQEILVAAMNVKLDRPVYRDSMKSVLDNPEIVEPVSKLVAEKLLEEMSGNEALASQLIRKFET
ncbi:MAG: hypothetical protein AAF597_11640 [Bacteroidota bacterium]